ncbi:MAG: diacylglycerol kinase family lipid kinase [Anaerolineaceae bacterium]|nr:diacylglycerol kinase family lipid kinase [Anaerolineaceae bacterium]
MTRYRIITNPIAGKGRALAQMPLVEEELNKFNLDYEIILTRYPWHAAELAQEAIAQGWDVVVSAGGDGTANEVLNGLMLAREYGANHTCMGLLPVGRGNDFGFGMGIPMDVSAACRLLAQGRPCPIDVGQVQGGLYPNGRYFGNGVGIGFDAVVGFLAAKSKLTGFMTYLAAALKPIALYYDSPKIELKLDDKTLVDNFLMVSIMNGRRMGGGFMMAPNSKKDDGRLDLCLAYKMNRVEMLRTIPTFFNGTQYSRKHIGGERSSQIEIRALQGTLPVHADGETICTNGQELKIKVIPRQIELICEYLEESL